MERLRNCQYISVGISDKEAPYAGILTEKVMRGAASRNREKKICVLFSFRSRYLEYSALRRAQ